MGRNGRRKSLGVRFDPLVNKRGRFGGRTGSEGRLGGLSLSNGNCMKGYFYDSGGIEVECCGGYVWRVFEDGGKPRAFARQASRLDQQSKGGCFLRQ